MDLETKISELVEVLENEVSTIDKNVFNPLEEAPQPAAPQPAGKFCYSAQLDNIIGKLQELNTGTNQNLIVELAALRTLANLINDRDGENEFNSLKMGYLIDISFFLKKLNFCHYDLPIQLLCSVLLDLDTDWLLKFFWKFLSLRIELFKVLQTDSNLNLSVVKHPGTLLIFVINYKIESLNLNNEKSRDLLKLNLLNLITDLFPHFDKLLINKNFEHNSNGLLNFRDKTARRDYGNNNNSNFYAMKDYYDLQRFLVNPLTPQLKSNLRLLSDFVLKVLLNFKSRNAANSNIYRFTEKKDDNSTENYLKNRNLESVSYYNEKQIHELYQLFNEGSIISTLRSSKGPRKTMITQLYLFINHLLNIYYDSSSTSSSQQLKTYKQTIKFALHDLLDLKRKLINEVDKATASTLSTISTSDVMWQDHVNSNFAKFGLEISEFRAADVDLAQNFEVKKKFWAAWGTPQLSRFWKTETGLGLLVEKSQDGSTEAQGTGDEQDTEADDWIGLRNNRRSQLFQFKNVNSATGVKGLSDAALKAEYDKQRASREQEKLEAKHAERLQRQQFIQEQSDRFQELERKRKLSSQDADLDYDEDAKRPRTSDTATSGTSAAAPGTAALTAAPGAPAAQVDLDY